MIQKENVRKVSKNMYHFIPYYRNSISMGFMRIVEHIFFYNFYFYLQFICSTILIANIIYIYQTFVLCLLKHIHSRTHLYCSLGEFKRLFQYNIIFSRASHLLWNINHHHEYIAMIYTYLMQYTKCLSNTR